MDNVKANAAAREYKLLKEAFVSGLNGGSIGEINAVTLVLPASAFLWAALQSQQNLFLPYGLFPALIDFLLNACAILFATTLYSSRPAILDALLIYPAIFVIIASRLAVTGTREKPSKKERKGNTASRDDSKPDEFPVKPFLTTYRGALLIITSVCILAVDFKVFPRRFAKVETWGTSLMDVGVGSFVFSAGTISARPVLKQRASTSVQPLLSRLVTACRHSLPLLALGAARLYTVKGLDYAEHVTEYGVHWNFFFTLALLPPFVTLFDMAFSLVPSYSALALLLGVAYEVALDFTDLKAYILTAPRENIISKNREGIFSFFGYLAIFLVGQATGMYTLPRAPKSKGPLRNPVLRKLAAWTCVWTALTFLTTSYSFGLSLPVSRRLANLPYVLWIAAFNTGQLTLTCAIETFLFPDIYDAKTKAEEMERRDRACSRLLRAFNRNGLALFLLANLLTGAVNLSVPTLAVSDLQAMAILLLYMAVLSCVALLLDAYNISVKL